MRELRLSTIGGVAALVTVAGFVVGIAMMATNGVQLLIPETGKDGAEWAADVQDAGNWFVVGAAIVGLAGFAGMIALIGFYDVLKGAGPVMILAPILGAVGLTLVTVSHVMPIAIAQELAPSYSPIRADTFDTFASTCLWLNYFGNVLNWGVVTPLYAVAILKTGALPRWIGYVGLVSAVFAGWLGVLAPASSVLEGLTTIGFFAFFIFLAAMGVSILRRREPPPEAAPAAVA
ncbi:MAG TPA: hypothetical protein VNB86_01030 [Gaiellaceae bacterium]|nr:hypothetical protein [Gaiellaceae bacterium]